MLNEFSGYQAGNYLHLLSSSKPFIANIHGIYEDSSSWVFTKPEIDKLLAQPTYLEFIKAILIARTVLFVGLSADDVAVGGHLEFINRLNIDIGVHFWITNRSDVATNQWAEKNGVRIIRYNVKKGKHTQLEECFQDLLHFIPQDDPDTDPVIYDVLDKPSEKISPPEILITQDTETIRNALNSEAKNILSDTDKEKGKKNYEKFVHKYDEVIHRAWYTDTTPGRNVLLGYTLEKEVAKGAFGKVYRGADENGNEVAVKVLLDEIRQNFDLLHCFRRGVKSMKILQKRNVKGMVAYQAASEIPAFVVMDWVDGPSLDKIIVAKEIQDWNFLLEIAIEIADIIRTAHRLPERVLHRDIRPTNIMLSNYYICPDEWEVKVLDFDLSWHRGATERSIIHGSSVGYLAPEQLKIRPGVSTRNALVDSFGFAMTLYYMLSREEPVTDQHKHKGWYSNVYKSTKYFAKSEWISLPNRIARLIINCTNDDQSKRWDMSQILGELQRLREALLRPSDVHSCELLAEEALARCDFSDGYTWNEDTLEAQATLQNGVTIRLQALETKRQIRLHMEWAGRGHEHRKNLIKNLRNIVTAAQTALKRGEWKIINHTIDGKSAALDCLCNSDDLIANIGKITSAIGKVVKLFTM